MNKYFVTIIMMILTSIVTSNDIRTFKMPDSCKSKGMEYCFDNANYPIDIIEELGKDIKNLLVAEDDDVGLLYSDRQGGSSDEDDCLKKSTDDLIYYIVDENGQDRVVVQLEGKFKQKFSVTWCEDEGPVSKRTTHFIESTVQQYKMSCQTKNMNYYFSVLSSKPDEHGKWSIETVKTKTGIPVCCVCRYEIPEN